MTPRYVKYVATKKQQVKSDVVFRAYDMLHVRERDKLDQLAWVLIEEIRKLNGGKARGFGQTSAIELIGKLGLYCLEQQCMNSIPPASVQQPEPSGT